MGLKPIVPEPANRGYRIHDLLLCLFRCYLCGARYVDHCLPSQKPAILSRRIPYVAGCKFRRAAYRSGPEWPVSRVSFGRHAVRGARRRGGGRLCAFADGDGLTVAAAAGVFGKGLGVAWTSSVWAALAARTTVTVWVSGLRLARTTGPGSAISGPARSGCVRPWRARGRAARSRF